MSDTLAADIKASIDWLFEESLDLSIVTDSSKLEYSKGLSDGVGENQADLLWHDTRTIAAGANDDLDLTALVKSLHGGSITLSLAKVKAILIHNTAEDAAEDLQVDSSAPASIVAPFGGSATSLVEIPADSPLLLVNRNAGWPVVEGSADILRITNLGTGPIDYKIVIVGTSA